MQKGRRVHISSRVELWCCLHRGEFLFTMVFIPLCGLDCCGEIFAWSLFQLVAQHHCGTGCGWSAWTVGSGTFVFFLSSIFFLLEYHNVYSFHGHLR